MPCLLTCNHINIYSATSFLLHIPSARRSTSATTASFSTGLNEHVEYTRRPPSLVSWAPRKKIWTWVLQHDDGGGELIAYICIYNICRFLPMQSKAIARSPIVPNAFILAQSTITTKKKMMLDIDASL